MSMYAYYNGNFGTSETIKIPLSDRAIFFGDGVYDAAIGFNGKIYLEDEHISRLLKNARRIGITELPTHHELSRILNFAVSKADLKEFFIYFQITRSLEHREHSYVKCERHNLLVTVDSFKTPSPNKRLSLITTEDLRYFYCDVKTINLLPSVLASGKAEESNCDEAVFHRGNTVTECAHSNISILKDGVLYTHPTDNLILPGITRKQLLLACEALGIRYVEQAFTLDELFSADEILVTSTSKLCQGAYSIDGTAVGGKDEKTSKLLRDFMYDRYINCNFKS